MFSLIAGAVFALLSAVFFFLFATSKVFIFTDPITAGVCILTLNTLAIANFTRWQIQRAITQSDSLKSDYNVWGVVNNIAGVLAVGTFVWEYGLKDAVGQ
ncbi:MAG: hypothetical protein AAF732_19565 [Pseudomonadota bacterium]